jgi:O-antigen/teichoic acid export membrane protein
MICEPDKAHVEGLIGRLKKDLLRYAPAAFVPAAVSVAGVAVFTRLFGPEAYGQYSLVLVAASITTTLLAGWIQQSVLRYLPRFKAAGELPQFMERFAGVLVMTTMVTLGIFLLLFPFLRDVLANYRRFYFPGVALILTGIIFQVLTSTFQADLRSGSYAKYKIAFAIGRLALALAFVFLVSRDIIGLIFAMALSYLILIGFMKRELGLWEALKGVHRSFDVGFLKRFASYGFPMIGYMMGAQILSISDRFVIGAFKGASEVGIYSANYSIVSMGIGLLTGPLLMAAHPLLISAWERGSGSSVPGLISTFVRYYLIIIVPVVFFVGAFSREFVHIFLGEEYREGFTIIPFVLAGYMIWGLSMYGQKGFELFEKTKMMLALVAVCAACNIILNLIFVPKYGYHAAAVTTFVSYSIYPVMVYRASASFLRWRFPWKACGKILASSLIATVILLVARKYFLASLHPAAVITLCGAVGLILFLLLMKLMKGFAKLENYDAGS